MNSDDSSAASGISCFTETRSPRVEADLSGEFRRAMALFPGAVTVVTCNDGGTVKGMVATAVCSLSIEPPSLLLSINKDASVHDLILREGLFAVNLLASSQTALAQQVAQRTGPSRFEGIAVSKGITGAPLIDGAPCSFDCRVTRIYDGYSHTIVVGVVEEVRLENAGGAHDTTRLVWQGRQFHTLRPL